MCTYGFLPFTAIKKSFRYVLVKENNRHILKRIIIPPYQNSQAMDGMRSILKRNIYSVRTPDAPSHTCHLGSREASPDGAENFLICKEEFLPETEESKTQTSKLHPETVTQLRIPSTNMAVKSASEEHTGAQTGMVQYHIEPRHSVSADSFQLPPGVTNSRKLSPGLIRIMKALSPRAPGELVGQTAVNKPPSRYVTLAPKPTEGPTHATYPMSKFAMVQNAENNCKLAYMDIMNL